MVLFSISKKWFLGNMKGIVGKLNMKKTEKIIIVSILAVAVVSTIALKRRSCPLVTESKPANPPATIVEPNAITPILPKAKQLPRLIDLGADKCIPCKMMAPILEELKQEYAEKLEVEFFDVWKNPDAAKKYKIRIIPTQIFFDASGKELFRHEGFLSKKDILTKWKELGIEFDGVK